MSRKLTRSLTYAGLFLMLALIVAASFPVNNHAARTASAQESEGLIQVTMADLLAYGSGSAQASAADGVSDPFVEAPHFDVTDMKGDLHDLDNVDESSDETSAVPAPQTLIGGGADTEYHRPLNAPFATGTVFTSVNLALYSNEGYGNVPPDTMGAVGPTQFVTLINGRWRVHDKVSGALQFDLTLNNFFQPVRNGSGAFDTRIRYDRETDRWFNLAINRELPNNRIFLAVSDNGIISGATVWTYYYYYAPSTINGGFDNTCFIDYIMMGVDTNAVYFGANVFYNGNFACGSAQFYLSTVSTSMWVVPKDLMLASPVSNISTITTAFTDLLWGLDPAYGIWTPLPADNYDPAATTGYGIGQDVFSDNGLVMININNPGGTPGTQTLSTAHFIGRDKNDGNGAGVPRPDVPAPTPGGPITNWGLDPLSYRPLGGAHVRDGSIWFSYSNTTNISGAAILWPAFGDRYSARWYQVGGIDGAPTIIQDADVYDAVNVASPLHYWMPSIMVSGQGHAAIGFSASSASTVYPSAAYANRLATDPPNFMDTPVIYQPGQGAYARQSFETANRLTRWGDYSMTTLDPCDDMTFYTIQQFADTPTAMFWGAGGNWAVSVAEIMAPPPPPFTMNPSVNLSEVNSLGVLLEGIITNGEGFFDTVSPEAMISACRIPLQVNIYDANGALLTIQSINWIDADSIEVFFSTIGAALGACRVEVINPDGQMVTSNVCEIVESVPPVPATGEPQYIVKSVDKSLANIGDTLTYTVTFRNPQGNTLNNVVISDTFDARLDNVRLVSTSLGTGVVSGNTVTVQGFSLAPGQSGTMVVTARISSRAHAGDVIANFATLESPDASIHVSNTVTTTIVPGTLPATGEHSRSILWFAVPSLVLVSLAVWFVYRRRQTVTA